MKYLISTILFILCPMFLLANNVIFTSSFENDLSSEWKSNLSTGLEKFERNEVSKYNGSFGLQMQFNDASQKGNLTTPDIEWIEGKKYEISFWYKAINNPNDNSATNIKFFSNDGTKLHQVNISNLDEDEWAQYTIEYTATLNDAAGYILFSFRPNNAGNSEYYFDYFNIERLEEEEDFFNDLKTKTVKSDPSILWQQFGPGMSGNCKSAFWHPTDPNVLFVGPNMGNSYGTWNKGKTYESVLNEDESDYKRGFRGPIEFTCVDFSRQDADFGMCTDERNSGIFYTENRGHKWTKLPVTTFDNKYVDAVAVDPKNENIWYAGGGRLRNLGSNLYPHSQPKGTLVHANSLNKIWKSTDKGKTWQLKATGLDAETGIETLLVDPKNSNIVYASTSTGFYKSSNGGNLWVKKGNGMDYDMLRCMDYHYDEANDLLTFIVISNPMWKANGNTITDDKGGLFKSIDRGETWTKISGNLAIDMSQFQNNADVRKSYYHCAAYTFDMTDADFEATYPTLPTKITIRFNTIEIDPSDVNNLYLNNEYSNASRNNFKPGQVWRSVDGGENWHVCLRNGKAWKVGSSDADYWANRNNPLNTNISLKYKKEWIDRDYYERKGCNFVKFNADGSVLHTQMAKISLMSYDKGVSWVDIDDEYTNEEKHSYVGAGNSNVPGHGFFQHPLMPNKVFCFAGENSLWVTNNEGDKVREGAQAAQVYKLIDDENSLSWYAVHPNDTTIHYALFFRQAKKGKLMRSTDSGETWTEHGEAVPYWDITGHSGDQSVHQIHLIIDTVNPDNMYFVVPKESRNLGFVGDSEIHWGFHKSSDGGANWTDSNVGLPASLDATMVAIDPNNNSTLYVTIQNANGGLFKSTNFGDTWSKVESTSSISGAQGINDIQFASDGKVYVTAGAKYANINDGGVWVSSNNMETWSKIFDYPWTYRIETAMYDANTILVSTLPNTKIDGRNAGVYLSKDGGESWIKTNKGNGQSDRINDIAIDNYTPGKYYASTYGSGWYVATDTNVETVKEAINLTITPDILKLKVDEINTLRAIVTPDNATYKNCIWTSTNPDIACVDALGVVKAIKKGSTSISAQLVKTDITAQINVIVEETGAFVKSINSTDLNIYPNPAKDRINIISEKHILSNANLQIYDAAGYLVINNKLPDNASTKFNNIDVSELRKGLYLLVLKGDKELISSSFIKD